MCPGALQGTSDLHLYMASADIVARRMPSQFFDSRGQQRQRLARGDTRSGILSIVSQHE